MPSFQELKETVKTLTKECYADFKAAYKKLLGAGAMVFLSIASVLMLEAGLLALAGGFGQRPNFFIYLAMPLVIVLHLGVCILGNAMQVAYFRICLKLARKEQVSIIEEVKNSPRFILPLFLSSFLIVPAIVLASMAFILPGIYLGLRFSLYCLAIADGLGPVEAVKKSFKMTNGHLLEILTLAISSQLAISTLMFVPILGLIGILAFMLPFLAFFWARYYVGLESSAESKPASNRAAGFQQGQAIA